MSGTSLDAVLFLISIIFDFYLGVLFIRLALAWVHANYNHPLTLFVLQLTQFIIKPMKKFLPDIRGLETSTLVLMFIVALIKRLLIILLSFGLHSFLGLILLAFSDVLNIMFATLSLILVIQALISWIQPESANYYILSTITAPFLKPIQRLIPPISGIDISLVVAMIILQLLIITISNPLQAFGQALAVGVSSPL